MQEGAPARVRGIDYARSVLRMKAELSRERLGSLALELCGAAYCCVAIVFTLQVFSLFFLVNPSVGEYVLLAVFGYVVLSALIFALAATGLGLAAALIHGLRAEGSRRQALAGVLAVLAGVLAGVLAVLLSVDVPVAIVRHLFGS